MKYIPTHRVEFVGELGVQSLLYGFGYLQYAGSVYRLTTADFEQVLQLREEPKGPEVETEAPPADPARRGVYAGVTRSMKRRMWPTRAGHVRDEAHVARRVPVNFRFVPALPHCAKDVWVEETIALAPPTAAHRSGGRSRLQLVPSDSREEVAKVARRPTEPGEVLSHRPEHRCVAQENAHVHVSDQRRGESQSRLQAGQGRRRTSPRATSPRRRPGSATRRASPRARLRASMMV